MICLMAMTIIACSAYAGSEIINVDRQGRRVQIDGFLLEWNQNTARQWGSSPWMWDAVNTVDGLAGYFTTRSAPPCSGWAFTITAVNTGRVIEIKIPEETAGGNFAFDRGSFENYGTYTAEWFVPWDFLGDGASGYKLLISAVDTCGGSLPQIALAAARPPESSLTIYVVILLAGVLTIILAAVRRKGRVLKYLR